MRIGRLVSIVASSAVVIAGLGNGPVFAAEQSTNKSDLRIGVLALADAIAAVGQTPELAEPLPFTRTSLADVLQLDDVLSDKLTDALGGNDLKTAMEAVPGVKDVTVADEGATLSFSYERNVTGDDLELAEDDGTLRFASQATAGNLDVTLATPEDGTPFVVHVDKNQPDPLLRFALVSEPELALSVDIATNKVQAFDAREGFTDVRVTGGHYKIHRDALITLRDPDGRGLLTLEDLRYSTLPDLFRVGDHENKYVENDIDVQLGLRLPDSVGMEGGSADDRTGTLTITEDSAPEKAWPASADASRQYGQALESATSLSVVDGITALSKYTGTTLALQNAADVQFPQLAGGTSSLFAPGDELLDQLATSAVAQIRCGLAPGSPPTGTPAPGDTVYCQAITPAQLGKVTSATWSVNKGDGTVVSGSADQLAAVGSSPAGTVEVSGSDGEPDVTVTLTAGGKDYTARTLPRTVQEVVERIAAVGDQGAGGTTASATLDLGAERLDIGVHIRRATTSQQLSLGNPGTLGALVGLTGLEGESADGAPTGTVETTAKDSRYDVGFGISTRAPGPDEERETVLVPGDGSLLTVGGLDAGDPPSAPLTGRIGFLGVDTTVTEVSLGAADGGPAVALDLVGALHDGAVALDKVIGESGTLNESALKLDDQVTASIGFTATEQALPAGGYATDPSGPASGTATVSWAPSTVPAVGFDVGYEKLRIFDPVPATFLAGQAHVTEGAAGVDDEDTADDVVTVTVDGGDLYDRLGVPKPDSAADPTEVARRLMGPGVGCQNVLLQDDATLTCEGLAPGGTSAFDDGESVDLIVLGDPFALRDGIIEGLSGVLNRFETLDTDNADAPDDQYTSTLPLVDLTPAQLATERTELRTGVGKLADAATEDEGGQSDELPSVSSVQEMTSALAAGSSTILKGSTGIDFTLSDKNLDVALGAETVDPPALSAPLRFNVNGPGQMVSAENYSVPYSSDTTLAVKVTTATARPVMAPGTRTVSRIHGFRLDQLAGDTFQAGAGEVEAASGSSASLDLTVSTTYTDDKLVTSRDTGTEPDGETDNWAASADLVLPTADPDSEPEKIVYRALATDSSGGGGAAQPAPAPMQVKYLAEGLDGLAAALGNALDGAAPRNFADGAPVSAPLIGTDLDAGAKVADKLTGLTSKLRDSLDTNAIADAASPAELATAVEDAVGSAVEAADSISIREAATAKVTCVDVPADEECDDATEWQEVSVRFSLTGEETTAKKRFDIGLAGLNVRSDKEEVETSTSWTLPVELVLTRGVGPQVRIGNDDALELTIDAALPGAGIDAIVGYLPAHLTAAGAAGSVHAGVEVAPAAQDYTLFDLYDGKLAGTPAFRTGGDFQEEEGVDLAFDTISNDVGTFDLSGRVKVPWTAAGGFGDVQYLDTKIDMGGVVQSLAKPFEVVDPYLGPVRDVVDVMRTPIPVVSDLSELGGGGEISLLSLLSTLGGNDARLTLALRVIDFIEFAADLVGAIAAWTPDGDGKVDLANLESAGALLTIDPTEVELASSCTATVKTTTTTTTPTGSTSRVTKKPMTCEAADDAGKPKKGARGQTTNENRVGTRNVSTKVSKTTKELTGSRPGFSVPFMADPDQLVDLITGEGEATYFRLDFGTLVASVSYTQSFGPIMAGPVPIKPFVGGSISVEGRLAVGFDSYPQTLAVRGLDHPGDVDGLLEAWGKFQGKDIITEGFYIDDLDEQGIDVPEVKMVTTLEAGAGVSIGIVTAGLKGGITLTINLDLADPNRDGKLRTAEIRDVFAGNAKCIFDVSATLEAFISVFVEIDLLLTSYSWDYDILRLGPYTLFEYGCPPQVPKLVQWDGGKGKLALTSGSRAHDRLSGATDVADDYEVRQFDDGDTSTYEVAAFNYVQRVKVSPGDTSGYDVTIFKTAVAVSTEPVGTHHVDDLSDLEFLADGGAKDDTLKFLQGETLGDTGLVTTPFDTAVDVTGGPGDDTIATGDADDTIAGGDGVDSIDAGLGDDVVHGDAGDDIINGAAGTDDIYGDAGNDRLQGGPGADRVYGGDGNDSVVGGPGRDVRAVLVVKSEKDPKEMAGEQARVGFDSGDILVGGPGMDSVDGGDGSDVVVGGEASTLTGADLGDVMVTGSRTVNTLSEDDEDRQVKPFEVDIVTAKVPDGKTLDALCASGPTLSNGTGTDFVTGGPEADVLIGSDGSDILDGGSGPDELCGRNGDDQLTGDGAATPSDEKADDRDIMRGGLGDDRLEGGAGDDVMFGDDVDLFRDGARVLDGSLGESTKGRGDDYLDGGNDDDILSGGGGSDQIIGGAGDDLASGEGAATESDGKDSSKVEDRMVDCNVATRVVHGFVDLNGDLLAGTATVDGADPDNGHLAGLQVHDGVVNALGTDSPFSGLLSGGFVVIDGQIDLNRDGETDGDDTGTVELASMSSTSDSNSDGDCIVAGEGDDLLLGGDGADHLAGGDGVDLIEGGDGYDLMLGDDGTDVLHGGAQDDVLVGGLGDDHLLGEQGDDRLRGNEGADTLVGGSETSKAEDGQDVLIGGRDDDVLIAENGRVVSSAIVAAVTGGHQSSPWAVRDQMPATVLADTNSELRFADSAVACGTGEPTHWATLLRGGDEERVAEQTAGVPLAYDELYGGFGCDWVFGSEGDDLVRGGQDDDVVEGGPGVDLAYGDAGDDVVIGGSTTSRDSDAQVTVGRMGDGSADGADTIYGDNGPDSKVGDDLLAGDNATPVRRGDGRYDLTLADLSAGDAETFGGDTIYGSDEMETEPVNGESDRDQIFGQRGDDVVHAGAGDDYVEGNQGMDDLFGGAGDDDLIGGSSSTDGKPLADDRLADRIAGVVDKSAAGVDDDGDTMDGGAGDDVMLGDNGRITRPGSDSLVNTSQLPTYRDVAMADTSGEGYYGSDKMSGGDGDDILYGQLDDSGPGSLGEGDELRGGADSDVLLGDLGVVEPTAAPQPTTLRSKSGMISEDVYPVGSWVARTEVPADIARLGGSDTAFGDGGDDVIRLGAGRDLANGGAGDDTVFGGDGDDALWGGADHDRIFGGYGDDDLDLKILDSMPPLYRDVAGEEDKDDDAGTTNGADLIYGGWGSDELQADEGGAGRNAESDQLIDWVGNHNLYYVCGGAYGAGRVLRQSSPDVMALLTDLVEAAGGTQLSMRDSGGWLDLGLVQNKDKSSNNKPAPEAPGNFTCEGDG